jgi:hypothetical protein
MRGDAMRERFGSYRYGPVLVLTVVAIVFFIAAPSSDWARVVSALLASATLVAAVWTSGASRRALAIALVAALAAVVSSLASLLSSRDTSEAVVTFAAGCLVAVAPVVIAAALFRAPEITIRTVLGALTVYLLIGLCFAFVYGVVGALDDDPFFHGTTSEAGADYVYFSFVTMATVGYGDLVAAEDLGRSMAVLEGILGQLYLVTVVALVVSNLGRTRTVEPR